MTDTVKDYVNIIQKVISHIHTELDRLVESDYSDRINSYGLAHILYDLEDMHLKILKQWRELEITKVITDIGTSNLVDNECLENRIEL